MTWVKDSDDVARDPALRAAGKDAALLWFVAMRECAALGTDGVMSPLMVGDAAHLYKISQRAAVPALVAAGLWHDADGLAACGPCFGEQRRPFPDGSLLIHEWWDHLLLGAGKDDPIVRKRERRRKALNSPKCIELRQLVRERDMDLCRYCGVSTLDNSGPDKKSQSIRTLDHVDPWGDNTAENLVVACRKCNGRKRDRTPDQAGMTLYDPGTTKADIARSAPDNPADDRAEQPEDPTVEPTPLAGAHEAGAGRIGSGRIGSGSGPAPDRVPVPGGSPGGVR